MNEIIQEQLNRAQHEVNILRETVSIWFESEQYEKDWIFHNIDRINASLHQIRKTIGGQEYDV